MFSRDKNRVGHETDPGNEFSGGNTRQFQETKSWANNPEQILSMSFKAGSRPPTPTPPDRLPSAERAVSPVQAQNDEKKLIVTSGITLKGGEILACDHLIIEGRIEADIADCRRIEVLATGSLSGSVRAVEVDIAGRYQGSLTVAETLSIGRAARVTGTIRYGRLQVEVGGEITGEIRALNSQPDNLGETSDDGTKLIATEIDTADSEKERA